MQGPGVDPPVVPEDPAARGRGTILLVEDNEMVRDLTRSMLAGARLHRRVGRLGARRAGSVREPGSTKIDLLLSDVVMPDMRGPELGERLRAVRPDLQVLFMSGYASSQVSGVDLTAESAHFIQKPFTMTELARSLDVVLHGGAATDIGTPPQREPPRFVSFRARPEIFRARRALEGTMAIRLPLFRPELDPVDRIEIRHRARCRGTACTATSASGTAAAAARTSTTSRR